MATCILTGTVESPPGTPLSGALVRVRTVATTLAPNGAGIATNDLTTTSAADGTWSLTLEQGLHAQIDIPAIGLLSDITIPALVTVALSALTLNARGTLTPATIIGTAGPSMGGDLTGKSPNPTVVGLRGKALHADTPADGKVWVYRTASGDYRLESFPVVSAVTSVTAGQGITVTGTTTPTVAVTTQGITAGMMATGAASTNIGALGGDLTGTLPNAEIAAGAVTNAEVNPAANIAWTKIDKTGAVAGDVGALGSSTVIAAINASIETPKIAAAQLAGGIAESQVTGLVSDLAAKRNTADDIPQASITNLVSDLAGKQAVSEKGAANGYAALDSGGKVPSAQLPSSTLADADRGDITTSSSGAVFTIDPKAVTYSKIQDVSTTDRLLGRATAGAGTIEEIPLTAAGRALLDDAAASDQRTTLGLGTAAVLNVPAIGDAAAGEVVKGTDTRLADARTPVAHTHAEGDVTGLTAALAAKVPTSRTIATTSPLSGGGTLAGDLTLSVGDAGAGAKGVVQLTADLGGTATSPAVALVGGQSAANVAAATVLANAAVSAKTNNAIVRRDASGAAALDVTGNVTGNVSGTAANVTGTVAVANGGTGQTTATTAFDALAPTSAKGDLISHNGADNVRLPVGTDGQILTADAASAAGVKWSAVVGTGTVTSVATGNGLQGGPITTTGTVDLKLLAAGGLSKTLGTGSELGIAPGGVADAMLATPAVPQARTITTTAPLTIGGGASADLSANRTLAVADAAVGSKGVIQLAGDLGGTAALPEVLMVGGKTEAKISDTVDAVTAATANNTANTIVERDASGNFAAGTITANLIGNITGNVVGNLTGNITGNATVLLRDKGGATFDVKSYGATGDGSTDDTVAIGLAVTAASTGGVIYFPPGDYKFSTLTVSTNGTILRGAGSGSTTLSTTSTGGTAITLSGDGTGLEGVTLDVVGVAAGAQLSVLASGENVVLSDLILTDWLRAVNVTGDGAGLADITLSSAGAGAIYGVTVHAARCVAENVQIGPSASLAVATGIEISSSANGGILRDSRVSVNTNATALRITNSAASVTGLVVENCEFWGDGTGVALDIVGGVNARIARSTFVGGENAVRTSGTILGVSFDGCAFGDPTSTNNAATEDGLLHAGAGAVTLLNTTARGGGVGFSNVHITGAASALTWDGGTLVKPNPFQASDYGVLVDVGAALPVLTNVQIEDVGLWAVSALSGGVLVGADVASAASISLPSRVTHVTGVTPIDTISAPVSSEPITLIPDGAWTFTTAGNIAVALKATAGVPITLMYDDVTAKWYPTLSVAPLTSDGTTVSVNGPLLAQRSVEAVTTTKSPSAAESREVYTNEGDADGAAVTLPTAAAGLEYTAVVQAAQLLTINAAAGDTIRIGANVTGAAGYVRSNVVGDRISLLAINATEWIATSVAGEWTDGTWWAYDTHAQGAIYWAASAATSNAAATPIKCAGTTAAQGTAVKVTQAVNNRLTYTGEPTRNFKVSATVSLSAAAATNGKLHLYKNGSLITGSTIARVLPVADIGAMALHATVSLAKNEYVELWCETDDGDDITIQYGVLSIASID